MQKQTAFATIAILSTALFSAILATTIHTAAALTCSPKKPDVCVGIIGGPDAFTGINGQPRVSSGSDVGASTGPPDHNSGAPFSVGGFCPNNGGPAAEKNGHTICST